MHLLLAAAFAPLLAETATFEAHHRPAAELAALVGFALRGEGAGLTADEKSNRVILTGSQAGMERARRVLADLDRPPRPLMLEVELTAGGGGAVWRAKLGLLSGVTGRVDVTDFHGLTLPGGGKLNAVHGRFTVTEVAEGLDVRGTLEVAVDGGAGARTVKVTGQARAKAGERCRLGEALTGAGETLGLATTAR